MERGDADKVSSRNHKAHFVAELGSIGSSHKREVRIEIIDDLGEDSRKVNRVDRTEFQHVVRIRVAEQGLDDVLLHCESKVLRF